jgi:transposase-like protein
MRLTGGELTMLLVNHFRSEQSACLFLESHIWNDHVICPNCDEQWRIGRLDGFTTTKGTWKCYSCRKPFSARRNTFFEGSHIQLHVWLQGLYILAGTQFQIGGKRLGIILGISLRSAGQLKHKVLTLVSEDTLGKTTEVTTPQVITPLANGNGLEPTHSVDHGLDLLSDVNVRNRQDKQQSSMMLPNSCRGTISTSFKCQAPSGTSELRFQRFLVAIENFDIVQTDAAFMQIFPRLLNAAPHSASKPKRSSAQPSPAP